MKRGRPKKRNKAKDRVIAVILSETAYNIYIKISKARDKTNWIHEYVSEKLKADFHKDFRLAIKKEEIFELQRERDKLEQKIAQKAYEIQQSKIKEEIRITANQMIDHIK